MAKLNDKKVAILVADMFEQVEFTEPRKALEDAGAVTEIISLKDGEVQGFKHYDKADRFEVDRTVEEVSVDDYDALLLPGGVGNPDNLRLDEAGVVRGRKLTSWPSLQTDVRNAGGTWVDEQVVHDGNLVTSRKPDDIPAFNRATIELFAKPPVHAGADTTRS
jgi:protease I